MAQGSVSTKEKIKLNASSLLQQFGYSGLSLQELADMVEIKKSSLYDHFDSKEVLVNTILDEYTAKFKDWTKSISNCQIDEKIKRLFMYYYLTAKDSYKFCLVNALTSQKELLPFSTQNRLESLVEVIIDWLAMEIGTSQRHGIIRNNLDHEKAAKFIYSMSLGCQTTARVKRQPQLILELRDDILNWLFPEDKETAKTRDLNLHNSVF